MSYFYSRDTEITHRDSEITGQLSVTTYPNAWEASIQLVNNFMHIHATIIISYLIK